MHIALNALSQLDGGSLVYLKGLLEDWQTDGSLDEHQLTIFASRRALNRLGDSLPPRASAIEVPKASRGLPGRMIAEQIELPELLRRTGAEALFCPTNTIPLRSDIPSTVLLQNAAPFDPVLQQYTVGINVRLRWAVLRRMIVQSVRKAARVIWLSRYYRHLVSRYARVPDSRCVYIPFAASLDAPLDWQSCLQRLPGLRSPFILSVGHVYPYRNYLQLVEAMGQLWNRTGQDWQLVIVGADNVFPACSRELQARARQLDPEGTRILLTGRLDHAVVRGLSRQCSIAVYPSVCESFGISLLEGLTAGKPALCATTGAFPEIAEDSVLYCDTSQPRAIAESLEQLVNSSKLREELSRRAAARAVAFPSR